MVDEDLIRSIRKQYVDGRRRSNKID
jgi:hypothetical protein